MILDWGLVRTGWHSTAFKEFSATVFFCIARKIKIGKIWNLVFLFIQPIADLSCKFKKFQYFFSKVVKFTWKIWNRLNKKKKQISHRYVKYVPIFHVNLKKKFWMNFFLIFFGNFWNLHGRSEICWIERKTNFQISIFRVLVILVSFFVTSSPQF